MGQESLSPAVKPQVSHVTPKITAVPLHEAGTRSAVPEQEAAWKASAQSTLASSAVPTHLAGTGSRQSGVVNVMAKTQALVSATLMEAVSPGLKATVADRPIAAAVPSPGHPALDPPAKVAVVHCRLTDVAVPKLRAPPARVHGSASRLTV